ncbi:MAG: hypothetical protein Q8K57_13360 [Thiobacillus sp.]|nr:hypothetical protein [Thiobacillus sp.]
MSKLKKQGRLVVVKDGERDVVDFELSDRLVRNTTDMGRAGNGVNAKPGSTPSAPVEPFTGGGGKVDATYRAAQAHERAFAAKKMELEYRKLAGDLVERSRVESAAFTYGRVIRDSVLGVPTRLAPELAHLTDAWEIEKKIAAALRQVLDDVAKMTKADLERAMEA